MISDEKMTEWRDIWQEIIETSRLTLIEETQNYKHLQSSILNNDKDSKDVETSTPITTRNHQASIKINIPRIK